MRVPKHIWIFGKKYKITLKDHDNRKGGWSSIDESQIWVSPTLQEDDFIQYLLHEILETIFVELEFRINYPNDGYTFLFRHQDLNSIISNLAGALRSLLKRGGPNEYFKEKNKEVKNGKPRQPQTVPEVPLAGAYVDSGGPVPGKRIPR